ncbi:hypothetical protein AA313_de0200672 [Arthrobotrys entomopaga]|nr:hypothetical protein AA313_de0200672 [Arthrobotrys entomopaga]
MSTIAIKLTSLAIRTLAKPIANRIKQQAKDHARFRAICIGIAQAVHRTDMRIRLNLLRDNSVVERAEEEEERQKKAEKQKAEQGTIAKLAADAKQDPAKKDTAANSAASTHSSPAITEPSSHSTSTTKKKKASTPHIRPLSDSKAIENGANFISEFFLFSVAGGLILFETFRSRKKESDRRDEVAERLQNLEEVDEIWRRKVEALERRLDEAGIKRVPELPPAIPERKDPLQREGFIATFTKVFSKTRITAPTTE